MKRILYFLLVILFASCTTTQTITETVSVLGIKGCTDKNAVNFNSNANKDDGTCKYDKVITDYNISVNDLMNLKKGMTKDEVLVATKLFPYEIYHNIDNCEIHIYNGIINFSPIVF